MTEVPGGKPCCGVRAGGWQMAVTGKDGHRAGGPISYGAGMATAVTTSQHQPRKVSVGVAMEKQQGLTQRQEREALSGRQQQRAAWSCAAGPWAWCRASPAWQGNSSLAGVCGELCWAHGHVLSLGSVSRDPWLAWLMQGDVPALWQMLAMHSPCQRGQPWLPHPSEGCLLLGGRTADLLCWVLT